MVGASAGDYYYIDDVSLTGPVTACVDGYGARPVAGTAMSVTGLTDAADVLLAGGGDRGRCTGDYSIVTNVTTVVGLPPKPTGLTASDGTETAHVALSWNNDSAKETGFDLPPHGGCLRLGGGHLHQRGRVVTYNDTATSIGTLYYWIVATNAIGSSSKRFRLRVPQAGDRDGAVGLRLAATRRR